MRCIFLLRPKLFEALEGPWVFGNVPVKSPQSSPCCCCCFGCSYMPFVFSALCICNFYCYPTSECAFRCFTPPVRLTLLPPKYAIVQLVCLCPELDGGQDEYLNGFHSNTSEPHIVINIIAILQSHEFFINFQ